MQRDVQTMSWPLDARPRLRVASVFPLDQRGFEFAYRSRTHALHLHDYRGAIRIAGREYALEPGTLTLTPAGVESRYDLPEAGTHWCVHFDPAKVTGRRAVNLPLVTSLGERAEEAARRLGDVNRLHALAQQPGPRHRVASAAAAVAMQDLLLWIALLDSPSGAVAVAPHHAAVDRLLAIIHHELNMPLCVPDLAKRVGMSQNYLARRFRQRMGQTMPGYILQRRIHMARLLLTTTNLPVKHIAARVGMPDAQHFNKQFRRLTGRSPTATRRAGV